jgi:hypothetical protein
MFRLVIAVFLLFPLSGCLPLLIAGGAGAAGGYYVGKHYDVDVQSPIEVKKEED